MSKYNVYFKKLGCDIEFPINDMEAWEKYPAHRWIYNRLELASYQGIKCKPMPIEPDEDDYPVILKPMINLYGMGLNCKKINDCHDFDNNWYSNHFWMTCLEGEHLSWDLIILNESIEFFTCFIGYPVKSELGKFNYWEFVIDNQLPDIVKLLVNEHFKDYTGCLNVETIGQMIIEAHLRMGDIFLFPDMDLHEGIIQNYKGNKYDWSEITLNPLYFFPFWAPDNISEDMFLIVKDVLGQFMIDEKENGNILQYEFDEYSMGGPNGWKRLLWFSTEDKQHGFDLRNLIIDALI